MCLNPWSPAGGPDQDYRPLEGKAGGLSSQGGELALGIIAQLGFLLQPLCVLLGHQHVNTQPHVTTTTNPAPSICHAFIVHGEL